MTALHRTAAWMQFCKTARPAIERSLPMPCVNCNPAKGCSGVVMPGERFDVAHLPGYDYMITKRMPHLSEVGPAHPACNRSAGAKLAAARRRAARARATRMPGW